MQEHQHERIKVLVETDERCFKGYVHKPIRDERFRLSDHMNQYGQRFICLSDVEVTDRGQHYRVGEKLDFVAVATDSITYFAPLDGSE